MDDIEYIIGLAVVLLGLASWGYKKYKLLTADGKISLKEVIDLVRDSVDKAEEVADDIKELED